MKPPPLSEGERHRLRLLLETNGTTDRQLRAHCKAHGGLRATIVALLDAVDGAESSERKARAAGLREAAHFVGEFGEMAWVHDELLKKAEEVENGQG